MLLPPDTSGRAGPLFVITPQLIMPLGAFQAYLNAAQPLI